MKAVRALLAALVMAAMALPLLLATPSAHAKEPESWAKISIDSVSPALPQRDRGGADVIRLAGRITNTSEVELSNLQVAFWRSLDPITNGEGMDRALESAANVPLGERAQGGSLYVDVPSDEDRTLAPEKSTTFAIEATLAQLELPDIDGVYLIGVHLRGRTEPDGPDITLGRGRIFLPVVSSPPAQQVQQTSVVLLTSRPSLLRARVLLDDHLVDEVGTDGRLTRLLQAAGATGTSFAVDPALVQEVQTMVNGYRVLDSAGSTTERPGSAAARAWLSKLSDLIRTGDGYRLLYGNPDIAALVHADLRSVLAESVVASKRVEATEELPLLILPGGGTADAETVAAAAKLDPVAVLLSDASVHSGAPSGRKGSPVLTGPDGVTLVRYTASASGGGPGPAPRNTPAKVQQRMLSDTWIAAKSAPNGSPAGRVRLVTEPSQSAGADNEVSAPWLTSGTLSQLLATKPVAWSGKYRYTKRARGKELTPAQLAATVRLSEGFDIYADLLVQPSFAKSTERIAVPRAVSLSWRDDSTGWKRYTGAVESQLSEILREQVSITAPRRVSTTGRAGTFPITVRNALPPAIDDPEANTIRVRLVFSSAASQRLTVAPLDIRSVAAGQAVTVNAQVEAETNGTVDVRARLETTHGSTVGKSVPVEVRATRAGTTGWLIAIGAGIVLIGTTALRIRQVSRERAKAEDSPEPIPVSRPSGDAADPGDTTQQALDV